MSFRTVEPATERLNRSELAVPGSREELFEKASVSAADVVFLDLDPRPDGGVRRGQGRRRARRPADRCRVDQAGRKPGRARPPDRSRGIGRHAPPRRPPRGCTRFPSCVVD